MLRLIVVAAAAIASLMFSAQAQAQTQTAVTPAVSENARDVMARIRPSVVQIKGFFGANTAQAFHGTGFAVAEGGVFMTNYHVVSQKVQYPDKYRLEYRTADGATGAITVLAVDVRHDLATVRADGYAPAPLKLETGELVKGARAYSVGFPLDVGLTITEGISNGKVDDSFEPRVHYSGTINSGMSGGPALNAAGEVIGVNVSSYRFEHVSFLVPAVHAQALRDKPVHAPADAKGFKAEVLEQVWAHSAELLGALSGPMVTQSASGYALPGKIAPFINCTGSGSPLADDPVQMVQINCTSKAGLYLQQGLYAGDLKYSHYVLTTAKLDAWRFTYRLSGLTVARGMYGALRNVGPYACEDRAVTLKGFDAQLMVCTRSYREMEGLYDFTVRVSSLDGGKQGFASHLDMHGLEFDAGLAFIRRYVEAMEWKP